ncbi:MAG: chromosome partitioning protein ParB [Bacteroidaceae bacterium]|nr:chromosome partitioning protein ParB [Bacteroidaceae bacterium]
MKQLSLFEGEELRQGTLFGVELPPPPKMKGGSANPIIFRDYASFVAKFSDRPKTTDDCYTPQDVFEAVVDYVRKNSEFDFKPDTPILRPFYPGGDYINADYPEDGVVIDNPPFSMFTKICKFYAERGIPFFLFGPGMTILSCCKYCTAIVVGANVTFHNGAVVRLNFASNIFGDLYCKTAPELTEAIKACPSQNTKVELPSYRWPDCVVRVSTLQTIANGGGHFEVRRDEGFCLRSPVQGREAFGDSIVLYSKAQAQAKARQKVLEARTITLQLKPEVEARRQRGQSRNYEDLT